MTDKSSLFDSNLWRKSSPHQRSLVTLVRDSHAAETVSQAYPKVRTVVGDLDDGDLVKSEAEKADIVLSMYHQELCWVVLTL